MISCNGSENGQVTASAQGGTVPYQYSIDGTNFSSQNNFSNLSAGNYILTVTDNNGCQQTFSTNITFTTLSI